MKKIIGILGVAVFAMAMFMNTNSLNDLNENLDLANLVTMNKANAEPPEGGGMGIFQATICVCGLTKVGDANNCDPGVNSCTDTDCSGYTCP